MFDRHDTIVAIATPHGRGGIGVVRIGGTDAGSIASALIDRDGPLVPRHATFAHIVDGQRRGVLDQVVVTWFAAPHSYTGEDVVEISGHGSPVLLRRIVELAMVHGARLAEPGEFTLRAYLNGRVDLVQAEAVADLVNAVTPLQARAAMDQLEGTLTTTIREIDTTLFDLTARLEASLDFPEEGFHFVAATETREALAAIRARLQSLAAEGSAGRVVREGRTVVIAGPPNAGKSSLFNALAGAARAIVTDVPGTTRDVLTERIDVEGLALTVVDTAGIREAHDAIEAEGIVRATHARSVAALTLLVLDVSADLSSADRDLARHLTGPSVIVANKCDLGRRWRPRDELPDAMTIEISARTGFGLPELKSAIVSELTGRDDLRDPPAISNVRHLDLVERAIASVERAITAIDAGATEELVLVDLTAARQALEELTGARTADDVLHHIFGKFCVGK